MDKTFMFEFVNEDNNTSITRLFEFTPLTDEAKAIVERDDLETLLGDYGPLELAYGVHDGAFAPGFTTYEVPEDKQAELMEKWRERFQNVGFEVGPLRALDATPQDFIFAITPDEEGGVAVYPNPRYIWETEECLYDQSTSGSTGLSAVAKKLGLDEVAEGTYLPAEDIDVDLETLKAQLIAEGLEYNEDFQKFIEDHS